MHGNGNSFQKSALNQFIKIESEWILKYITEQHYRNSFSCKNCREYFSTRQLTHIFMQHYCFAETLLSKSDTEPWCLINENSRVYLASEKFHINRNCKISQSSYQHWKYVKCHTCSCYQTKVLFFKSNHMTNILWKVKHFWFVKQRFT